MVYPSWIKETSTTRLAFFAAWTLLGRSRPISHTKTTRDPGNHWSWLFKGKRLFRIDCRINGSLINLFSYFSFLFMDRNLKD